MSTVVMEMKLPAKVKKERDHFVSSCPVLDVVSQGETKTKAMNNLVEAVSLFLISCFERGTLYEVLKDCGFTASRRARVPARTAPVGRYQSITVPVPFQIHRRTGEQRCHA